MKPNELGEESSSDWVGESLRRLPFPDVPASLQDRLFATIPFAENDVQPNCVARESPRWKRVFIAIAACVAIVCFSPLWLSSKRHMSSEDPMKNFLIVSGIDSPERTVEIQFEGETDPCNILGPQFY